MDNYPDCYYRILPITTIIGYFRDHAAHTFYRTAQT